MAIRLTVDLGLLEHPDSRLDALLQARLEGAKGQVNDDERSCPRRERADDRLRMVDHLVERDHRRRVHPERDLGERVSN